MASSAFVHRRATSSLGSVLSFDDLGIDVESVIGHPGSPTSMLVAGARAVADSTLDVILRSHENHTIFVGKLLHALLYYASKNPIPNRGAITGERYTAGVIYAAYCNKKVGEVAELWYQSMLLPMKAAGNHHTVEPTDEQTPQNDLETLKGMVTGTSRRKLLREQVCQREQFRCPLHKDQEIEKNAPPSLLHSHSRPLELTLKVCHIIPFSLNDFDADDPQEIHFSAVTWLMIQSWTSVAIQDLIGEGINDPSNALLLCPNGHDLFGRFRLYFEPTGVDHCYVTKTYPEGSVLEDIHVDFHSGTSIPPPDPRYLAIHATFAKLFRAAGAAEYIERYFSDHNEKGTFASNGSTDVSALLSKLHIIPVK